MKFLCVLFSLMVMLLTVRPCCADNCTSKTSAAKSASKQKEKECAGCSPFFACGSCTGFIVTHTVTLNFIAEPDAVQCIYVYRSPYLQQIPSSIWQPPQLV